MYLLIIVSFHFISGSHVTGTFKSNDFFKFLVKFGFQKTDRHQKDTHGYIFGNITSNYPFSVPVTFAVLDTAHFLGYYENRLKFNKEQACKDMFNRLNTASYDAKCNPRGIYDFLRRIPCPKGELCVDEDYKWNVVQGNQFTYVIEDFRKPKFWYISMVACYHNNTSCDWHYYDPVKPYEINYDIWIVNGNPNQSTFNTLTYQFSFDQQNTLELYLVFWLCYMVLVPLQCYASRIQKHPVTKLFTASLLLDFIALSMILLHTLKFALDGVGYPNLSMAGDIFDILSRTSFMLLLLLLAKGWAVTRIELTWKPLVFSIWLCYGIVHILLYVWNLTEVDIIEDIDEYQTWPGWLIIIFRSLIMIWFVFELRNTMLYEHNTQKLHFFLHFGASSLVWFIYLPIIALIALHVSPLWRYKLLVGITYSADCFAYCIMAHLLWPTRSEQYFLLASNTAAEMEELDEFNEAPHVINHSYASLSSGSLSSLEVNHFDREFVKKNDITA